MATNCRMVSAAVSTLLAVVVAGAAIAQLTDDERACTDQVYRAARNVGKQEANANRKCVRDGSGDVDACVDPESAKAAMKRVKLLSLDDPGRKCETTPPFGVNPDLAAIADATEKGADTVLRRVFGNPVDGIVGGSKCQDAVAKRAAKKFDLELKGLRDCARSLAAIDGITDLDGCVAGAIAGTAAALFEAKLVGDMHDKCDFSGSAPAGMEDGDCNPCGSGAACGACIGRIVNCQACEVMNAETGGNADCDVLDDGVANYSCVTCGIGTAGRYTQTTTGGVLKVATFLPFPFPTGATTIEDVSAPGEGCVSSTVIPYPGGLTVPSFCIPATGFTVQVRQTGCGVGVIDSDGGSDLTITEQGDTSYGLYGCAATQSCLVFADSSGDIDVTVGDGSPDTCTSGIGNAVVSVPVEIVMWLSTNGCPDSDDSPSEGDDSIIAQFPATLDLTTDRAVAQFTDTDADGCSFKGIGPAGPYTQNQLCSAAGDPYACCTGLGSGTCVGNGGVGQCIDFAGGTVSMAGGGMAFASAGPLHDVLFASAQSASITGPAAYGGATCGSPPAINFAGVTHRCIIAP